MVQSARPPAEAHIDAALVEELLRRQHPQFLSLKIEQIAGDGWDNEIFRLGDSLAVRLPRRRVAAERVEKQHRWLPLIVSSVPVDIPVALAAGTPACGFPWRWSVTGWFSGEPAAQSPPDDVARTREVLVRFLKALQRVDVPAPTQAIRELPLEAGTGQFHLALHHLRRLGDPQPLLRVWQASLELSESIQPPTWFHGDLHPGNLLVRGGSIIAIIDWDHMGIGDRACDLISAWALLTATERNVIREDLEVDDATWLRGRGWALLFGAVAFVDSARHDPMSKIGRRTLLEVMEDAGEPLSWLESRHGTT